MKKGLLYVVFICFAVSLASAQIVDQVKFELGLGEKKKGYYNTTQISLLMGNKEYPGDPYYYYDYYLLNRASSYIPYGYDALTVAPIPYRRPKEELQIIPSFTMVNGYMFNERWSAGIGLGIEIFEYTTFPVFAEIKYTLWNKKISPYFTFKGGYSIADLKEKQVDEEKTLDYYPYQIYKGTIQNYGGLMLNPEIGVKVKLSLNADLLISAGYRYQELKSKAIEDYDPNDPYYNRWDNKEYLNRLVFGLAVLFK